MIDQNWIFIFRNSGKFILASHLLNGHVWYIFQTVVLETSFKFLVLGAVRIHGTLHILCSSDPELTALTQWLVADDVSVTETLHFWVAVLGE